MIIDLHAHLGHYPFRRLRHNSAPGLVDLMDRSGIDLAVVSSLNSVFYRNTHEGNRELKLEVEVDPKRLIPLATVNPSYAGWKHDIDEAIKSWQWKGAYLVPAYHQYRLTGPTGQAALEHLSELNVPVVLPQRLEDRRQQHAMDTAVDLEFDEVAAAVRPFPDLKVILLNWGRLDGDKIRKAGLADRVLIDITRMSVLLGKPIPKLIDSLGIEAVAFGSHIPMATPGPALLKLQIRSSLSAADRDRIAWKNTADFLAIDVRSN